MTIKKTIKKTVIKTGGASASGGSATGGAAIADRFKLASTEPEKSVPTVNRKAAMWALIAGVLAIVVSGILVYVLYDHWKFLMPA